MMRDSNGQLAPRLPTRSTLDPLRQVSVSLQRRLGTAASETRDELAVEEPLELLMMGGPARGDAATGRGDGLAVIMRTPGHDDELAAGFLYTEGLLRHRDELLRLAHGTDADGLPTENVLQIYPAPDVDLAQRAQAEGFSRRFAVNASCGVCGKNTVESACAALPAVPDDGLRLALDVLYTLPKRLREQQHVFSHTGGLHAGGLFDSAGTLLALREDVGRHNAVDKLIGWALLRGQLPMSADVLMVSGRLSYEIVLKALAAGIPIVAAVSAPTSLAVDLAQAGNITIAGFLRGTSVNMYTHPWRICE
jgi:FdhD protein